jgi:PAS domain S-box-containing protein
MKQKISGQERFFPFDPQTGVLTIHPEFGSTPAAIPDHLKLLRELQGFQIELTRQNMALLRSQQEFMKSKIYYTELYDTLPMGYITLDSKGVLLNANLTFAAMVCAERPSLLNQRLMDYIVPRDHEIYRRHLKDLKALKTEQGCELNMQRKNGTVFDVMLKTAFVSNDHKKPERYRTAVIDISEHKRLEKEQAKRHQADKMESIRGITGGIAHDFNNILHILLGTVEMELDSLPGWSRTHKNLKKAKDTILSAAGIVARLLHISYRMEPELRPTGIAATIQEALKCLSPLISSPIDIRSHFPAQEVNILADHNQIHQMFMNLFTNAIQAMEGSRNGILEITVETEHLAEPDIFNYTGLSPGEYVKITIKDTGPGIHPEIIHQIFDPYFTTRGLANASGMGLAIVQAIVKNHKGDIAVDSRPGEGTVFTLVFPLIITASK